MHLDAKDWLAAYAAVLSTLVFFWSIGKEVHDRRRTRKERSRLSVYMNLVKATNRPDGNVFHLLPLHVSNLGREPVIVTSAVARGLGHEAHPGLFAEPGASYGQQERMLPKRLEAGETVELSLFTIGIFRNDVKEIVVLDTDDREYKVSAANLRLLKQQCEPLLPLN